MKRRFVKFSINYFKSTSKYIVTIITRNTSNIDFTQYVDNIECSAFDTLSEAKNSVDNDLKEIDLSMYDVLVADWCNLELTWCIDKELQSFTYNHVSSMVQDCRDLVTNGTLS